MDRYTANRYIWLKDKIAAGGSVPQELLDEVDALDATVNGDETQDPPVEGLVDKVLDLEEAVDDLDTDINGDATTEPPTPGLKDRVAALESGKQKAFSIGTVTATTGSYGSISVTNDDTRIIIYAYCTSHNAATQVAHKSTGGFYFNIIGSDNQPIANTEVSCTYYYL